MTLKILDPTVEPDAAEATLAPRPAALDGVRLGLLANGKVNGGALLGLVAEALRAGHGIGPVIARAKDSASRVAPPELLDELARDCDAVVTAIGD
jgi:hypothetical protein